jgi:protein-S-isoprenylcysteine O-methyltransferase Ste14
MIGSFLSLFYGLAAYVFFVATISYTAGFVANLGVPKSIDSGATAPLAQAIAIDLALLAVFAIQHSVMARRGFKDWWTRIVPQALERSTYVLAATLALAALLAFWQPIPEPLVWRIENPLGASLAWAVCGLGWTVLLISTFLIDHFELLGLRQASDRLLGRAALAGQKLRTPLFYRYVRHPIYFGFLLAFWATPAMSAGHLLFAAGMTGYILVGIWFEERDLIALFGEEYRRYRRQVGMLFPGRRSS